MSAVTEVAQLLVKYRRTGGTAISAVLLANEIHDQATAIVEVVRTADKTTSHAGMTEPLQDALKRVDDASEGDSNDAEIDALYQALEIALSRWPGVEIS